MDSILLVPVHVHVQYIPVFSVQNIVQNTRVHS